MCMTSIHFTVIGTVASAYDFLVDSRNAGDAAYNEFLVKTKIPPHGGPGWYSTSLDVLRSDPSSRKNICRRKSSRNCQKSRLERTIFIPAVPDKIKYHRY